MNEKFESLLGKKYQGFKVSNAAELDQDIEFKLSDSLIRDVERNFEFAKSKEK